MGLRVRVYRVKSLKWLYMGLCREYGKVIKGYSRSLDFIAQMFSLHRQSPRHARMWCSNKQDLVEVTCKRDTLLAPATKRIQNS